MSIKISGGLKPSGKVTASITPPPNLITTMTAGSSGGNIGYDAGSYGSLTETELGGHTFIQLRSVDVLSGLLYFELQTQGIAEEAFTRLEITGTFSTGPGTVTVLFSSNVNYNPNASGGTATEWTWNSQPNFFVNGNDYTVELVI